MKVTIRLKGGTGSGHFGHSGRPGLVGGSSSSGMRVPAGYADKDAYNYARWMLSRSTGEEIPGDLRDISEEIYTVMDTSESYGTWAAETIDKYHIQQLMQDNSNLLNSKDRENLENIAKLNSEYSRYVPGLGNPYKVVMVDSPKLVGLDDNLAEWGINSPHELRPADLAAVGWWDFNQEGFTINIANNASDYGISKREVFWHEFGHTLPVHIIQKLIGNKDITELSGDYMDRFAKYMAAT